MSLTVTFQSLSSLIPVEMNYNFNNHEYLAYDTVRFSNSLKYFKYNIFENFQDVCISKNNILCLTDSLPLTSVFKLDAKQLDINSVSLSFYLSGLISVFIEEGSPNADEIAYFQLDDKNNLYYGSLQVGYKPLLVTSIPYEDGTCELHIENNTKLKVSEEYPFYVQTESTNLYGDQLHRQRFILEYSNNLLAIKTKTKHGYRYISYDKNNHVIANGLRLADLTFNNFLFAPVFVTSKYITANFKPSLNEVQYYNAFNATQQNYNVDIKQATVSNTNLLVSCPTRPLLEKAEANINIATLKTNFTSSETYTIQNNE